MGSGFRLRLPATSANLGAAFDTAAVALDFHLEIEAEVAESFSIIATGRNADLCSVTDGNLILTTYCELLEREGIVAPALAVTMHNQIPLGMGCGSSAAGRLAAIALAVHFGGLGWTSAQILAEACVQEGHPDNAAACWLGGLVIAACEGRTVHAARVEPPQDWRALVVIPTTPLATSKARAVLPAEYSRADAVANIQAASLLGLAFAHGRGELLRPAMADRVHQPYRMEICPLLPSLLPLAGSHGILGVALSGAGPSVLLIVSGPDAVVDATSAVLETLGDDADAEILVTSFEHRGVTLNQ
ncbi:homoserine kinase [Acidicapsa ligni]|uniref:homoserine kinase n=1 Tax=Acidicapsa ligni TaxID=542300 RepID=UPI0021DF6C79|nr:homoserine kinase [Acidicapsa ligni]